MAPEWSFVFGRLLHCRNRRDEGVNASAEWIYIDDQLTSLERDPLEFQDSIDRVDASLMLSDRGNPWTFALVGKNLTDELVHNFGNAASLSGGPIFAMNLEETRSIALYAPLSLGKTFFASSMLKQGDFFGRFFLIHRSAAV